MITKQSNISAFFVCIFLFNATVVLKAQDLKSAIRLTHSEQFELAEKTFRELIQKDSKNGDNYYYFGENFLKSYFTDTLAVSLSEMLDSAQLYYSRGIKADAACPLNYVGLGSVALYKKDVAGAKAQFDRAISILPSKKYKDSPVSKEKAALTLAKIAEAYIYLEPKDIPQAVSLINQALEFDKTNYMVYIIAGDIYLEDNDGSKAIQNYKKAQEYNMNSTLAKTKTGNIYVRVKNLNAAIPYFEEAVTIDPNFAPVYRELGDLYYKAGKYDKAEANYQKFLELSNNFAAKTKYITLLYLIKKYDEATKYIDEVFKVDTNSVILNRIAAYCLFESGKYPQAQKTLERFFRKAKPEKILSNDYAYFGKILAKQNLDSLAIEKFGLAIKLDSTNADVLSEIGAAYTRLKQVEKAVPYYEKKISINKASILDYFNLAKIYYGMVDSIKTSVDTFNLTRCDTLFGIFVSRQPESMNGLSWKARVNVKMDPDSKKGLAKVWYDKVLEKALTDSVKYRRDMIEALEYIGSYHLFTVENKVEAKKTFERIIAIDPKNTRAKAALESKELKNVKIN